MKKPKIQTPEWVLKGYNSEKEYLIKTGKSKPTEKNPRGKTFKIRKCPKCKSKDVSVFLGMEEGKGKGEWECKKCKWRGKDVLEEEVSENDFLKYLDEMEAKK